MFGLRRANICGPHRVKVQREPDAPDNVLVRRGAFDAVLEPIRRAGEKAGVQGLSVQYTAGALPLQCWAAWVNAWALSKYPLTVPRGVSRIRSSATVPGCKKTEAVC